MPSRYEGAIRVCLLHSIPLVHTIGRPVPDRLSTHALAMLATWQEGEPAGSEIHRARARDYLWSIGDAIERHGTALEAIEFSGALTPDGELSMLRVPAITAENFALLLHQDRSDVPPLIAAWFEMCAVPWPPVVADDQPLTWDEARQERRAAIGKRERWTDRQVEAARHEFERLGGYEQGRKSAVATNLANEIGISRQAFLRSIGIDSRTPGVTSDTRRPSNQAHRMGASIRPRRIR
ncbi:MAG TPA: hypothetical protein PKA16_04220 [Ottowia sp.]|uniref:hypothetical protein n=1 Tax=Ottowia sp. TaxID=1898956 RepID=UPI002C4BCE05|nr:hypothetical protein [Ottowia sp.]HMN20581.1 hypothetical protein [Ottowia sp.]